MAVDLFDAGYYREANADLAGVGIVTDDQLRNHFFNFGLEENRSFSRIANLGVYRAGNSDLAGAGIDTNTELYSHLANYGVNDGRRFSLFFDPDYYRLANFSDLGSFNREQLFDHAQRYGATEGRNLSAYSSIGTYRQRNSDLNGFDNLRLFDHLRNYGVYEGRTFSQFVDVNFYLGANSDLGAIYGGDKLQALQHLELYGTNEGRRFSPFVDINTYNIANPDLRASNFTAQGLLNHLVAFGANEFRRFAISFDPAYYRDRNPDLAGASITTGVQLLDHYQLYGLPSDGRSASDSFNVITYKTNNPDLAGLSNTSAQQHFEITGFREGILNLRAGASNEPLSVSVEPGDTLNSAANLGAISARRGGNITGNINSSANDRIDTYRLLLPVNSTLNLNINNFNNVLGVQLIYDKNGNGINDGAVSGEEIFSPGASGSPISLNRTFGAGTYFLRIFNTSSTTNINTNYNLSLSAATFQSVPDVDPGSTLATALNIGTLTSAQSFLNFVGSTDNADIYGFNLTTPNSVRFDLGELNGGPSGAVELQLINDANNNGVIDSSDVIASRNTTTSLSFNQAVGAGTYFVRVRQLPSQPNSNTIYRFTLSPIA